MSKSVLLQDSANGFCRITTESYLQILRLKVLLLVRYRFTRRGTWMPAVTDDGIYPSFVRDQMIIDDGWDNWFGYDLIATDVDSDAFLRGFYKAHV